MVAAQVLSAGFFAVDVIGDLANRGLIASRDWHLDFEILATVSLCAAIVFEMKYILNLLRRKAHLELSVSIASTAIHDVIEAHFDKWQMTPSERDVATFLVKGLSTAEIAEMRGSAEGTIKSHLNSIYRKSGTRNRAEVLSLIIDSLMDGPVKSDS